MWWALISSPVWGRSPWNTISQDMRKYIGGYLEYNPAHWYTPARKRKLTALYKDNGHPQPSRHNKSEYSWWTLLTNSTIDATLWAYLPKKCKKMISTQLSHNWESFFTKKEYDEISLAFQ